MNKSGWFDRDRLILENISFVEKVAMREMRQVGDLMEFQDLVQAGLVGLIQAADRFDGDRSEDFRSFAWIRIRGEIIEQFRSLGFFPRLLWRDMKRVNDGNGEEISESRAEFIGNFAMNVEFERFNPVGPEEWGNFHHFIGESDDIAGRIEREDLVQHLISRLSDDSKHIIVQYFWNGRNFREICRDFNKSEATIWQRFMKILKVMRAIDDNS